LGEPLAGFGVLPGERVLRDDKEMTMLGKLTRASLLVLGTIAMPAMAQNNATQPSTNAQQPTMATTQTQSGQSAQVMTQASQNDWRASKLIGVNIYGSNNEKIGDVNEILLDQSGQAKGVIIGVGGFLGIGEKNVAIPFDKIEWVNNDTRMSSNAAGTNATGGQANSSAASTSNMTGSTANRTTNDVTGTVANESGNTYRGYPDHGVLRMTKADLQNAPSFRWPNGNR
jgi:sporulation protein YlmC with PRC-barrel domain